MSSTQRTYQVFPASNGRFGIKYVGRSNGRIVTSGETTEFFTTEAKAQTRCDALNSK